MLKSFFARVQSLISARAAASTRMSLNTTARLHNGRAVLTERCGRADALPQRFATPVLPEERL